MFSVKHFQDLYSNFLVQALGWLYKKNYDVDLSAQIQASPNGQNISIHTIKPIYCRDWPYRVDSNEKIDILAEIQETVSLKDGCCTKSTIRVNYFHIYEKTALATESLHYDYVFPFQERHPICHAQNDNRILDSRPESFNRSRTKVRNKAILQRCRTMRIPSAFVNLPGLLAILAADHLQADHWKEFMRDVVIRRCHEFPQICHSSSTCAAKCRDNATCTASGMPNACACYELPKND